ncbi:MAG: (S)-sulfolactate dehydrogenase [Phycisphaerales bacterium]|jgi:D-3-phosphoglycerate dehydrogenase|nr:(S)-sulfolactate dehydrogenase [Phycisphaerales bacterium]
MSRSSARPTAADADAAAQSLPVVVVTEGSDPRPLEWLRQRAQVVEVKYDDPAIAQQLARAAGVVVRTYTKVNEAFLASAPHLKVVGRGGVGLENIDVAACRRRGIEVVYTPDANTLAVGDFVFGGMIELLRPFAAVGGAMYPPTEFKRIRGALRGRQLNELTLGILGMGRVGRRVSSIAANGFGMRVIYNDVIDIGPLPFAAAAVDKETLYREADVLSLHVDMRKGNEHLVGRPQLAAMKPTAILINTSRGEVLDIAALAEAIRAKKLAGAMIDVFDPEPPAADFALVGLPNVLLTPHMAARTHTAIENMSWVVRDIVEVLEGRPPKYPAPTHQ